MPRDTFEQTVTYTPLPHGYSHQSTTTDGDRVPQLESTNRMVRLSVLISPRLEYAAADDTTRYPLANWPDWLNWPSTLATSPPAFTVRFEHRGSVVDKVAQLAPGGPERSVSVRAWAALFGHGASQLSVLPFRFDDYTAPHYTIYDHPFAAAFNQVKATHTSVARGNPVEYPVLAAKPVQALAKPEYGNLGQFTTPSAEIAKNEYLRLQAENLQIVGQGAVPFSRVIDPGQSVARLLQFHQSPGQGGRHFTTTGGLKRVIAPELDFHQVVSSLAQHPRLLRQLGLIIDLDVPIDGSVPPQGMVHVIPHAAAKASVSTFPAPDAQPRTMYRLTATAFEALSDPAAGEGIVGGMLPLGQSQRYTAVQIDVDGAVLKMNHLADTVAGVGTKAASLPALRSTGFTLTINGRKDLQLARFARSKRLHDQVRAAGAAGPPVLYAEDLVHGYVIDVWDKTTTTWYSLCRRDGAYHFADDADLDRLIGQFANEEGFVAPGATQSQDPTDPSRTAIYVPEPLCRWHGWSLVAPRPGLTLGLDGTTESNDTNGTLSRPQDQTQVADWKATLTSGPGVRFNSTYWVHKGSLPKLRLGRTYRMRARVIDVGGNKAPLGKAFDPQPDHATALAPQTYYRFDPLLPPVVIPRTDVRASMGEGVERLVVRSGDTHAPSSYHTPDAQRHLAPPRTTQSVAESYGLFDGKDPEHTYQVIIDRLGDFAHLKDGKTGDTGTIKPFQGAMIPLPYLPDPSAQGVAFVGLPGLAPDEVFSVPFEGGGDILAGDARTWPNISPFRIKIMRLPHLAGMPPKPSVTTSHDEGRVLTVYVPKGRTYTVRYSSQIYKSHLQIMGMYQWMLEGDPSGDGPHMAPNKLIDLAETAQHWMITPFREMSLVHAVQRPIRPSGEGNESFAAVRAQGDTTAVIVAVIPVDGPSTVKIDLEAVWVEQVDAPPAQPRTQTVHAHVLEAPVDAAATSLALKRNMPYVGGVPVNVQHFGDTRHRVVDYTAVGTTRYAEYFGAYGQPSNSDRFDPAVYGTEPIAEFPKVSVKSSARPAAPKVLYVVPAFGWSESTKGGTITRTRSGALRVYLDRPWYSSGEGELLGVVLARPDLSNSDDSLEMFKHFVTQSGLDPTVVTAPVPDALPRQKAGGFSLDLAPAFQGQDFALAEHLDRTVDVDAYEVVYDPQRSLYYADVALPAGNSYAPFVRLALVRCQPESVPGVEISPVVVAEFLQLTPDRTASATLAKDAAGHQGVNLSVTGVFGTVQIDQNGGPLPKTNDIHVSLEQQLASGSGDQGWMPIGDAVPLVLTLDGIGELYPTGIKTMSGSIQIPADATGALRLVLREYEYQADAANANNAIPRRIVYADVLALSSLG